jgi:hypothetical protein
MTMKLEGMSLKQLRQAELELTRWLAVETVDSKRGRIRSQLNLVSLACKSKGRGKRK